MDLFSEDKLVFIKCNDEVKEKILNNRLLSGILNPKVESSGLVCIAPDAEIVVEALFQVGIIDKIGDLKVSNIKTFKGF
ncbi:MAG: hypothetical protein KAS32_02335 [Candidatus Peribacteraceae bacterium]|nr:hypothetical protein [Candidatus Peribacteraceae bacterium]